MNFYTAKPSEILAWLFPRKPVKPRSGNGRYVKVGSDLPKSYKAKFTYMGKKQKPIKF